MFFASYKHGFTKKQSDAGEETSSGENTNLEMSLGLETEALAKKGTRNPPLNPSSYSIHRNVRALHLRLCYKSPVENWFLSLFLMKNFQRSYFHLYVTPREDFKALIFRGENLLTLTHLLGSIYRRGCVLPAFISCLKPS